MINVGFLQFRFLTNFQSNLLNKDALCLRLFSTKDLDKGMSLYGVSLFVCLRGSRLLSGWVRYMTKYHSCTNPID